MIYCSHRLRSFTRSEAEENFKAESGHYPIRVKLPEPTPDPQLDALIARWSRRGQPPMLRSTDGSVGSSVLALRHPQRRTLDRQFPTLRRLHEIVTTDLSAWHRLREGERQS